MIQSKDVNEKILNITNGDSAVNIMKKANLPGDFLPWRDILHDGPVPEGLSFDELSEVRAQFIIEQGWGEPENIRISFDERAQVLNSIEHYDKVILWFEHDLYDQLQILQILDWFSGHPADTTELSIICTDQYLGLVSPDEMKALQQYEEAVSEQHLTLSGKAWAAFRSDTPDKWCALPGTDTAALPFLKGAILRMLEEYPDCTNGLSRTEYQALKIIADGEKRPGRVFGLNQDAEERRFMGDSSFWEILHAFLEAEPPLLELPEGKLLTLPTSPDQELTITQTGRDVLSGKKDWLGMTETNRWLGGVHLTADNIWCRNRASDTILKRT